MPETLTLTIITPEKIVLDQKVDEVSACAIDGEFAVLPDHIPLVSALANDVLIYKSGGIESVAAVLGGILEVSDNKVTVLSDAAELATEIDEARARQAKQRAEAEKTQRTDKLDVYVAEMAFSRAMARLKAADLYRRKHRRDHM
jgi:F-type H+-transporting ATPase subunit epsilon